MEFPLRSHPAQIRIIHIEEHLIRSAAKIIIQFTLGLHDTLEGAEAQEVSLSDICYEAIIRQGDIYKFPDVSRVACAHLDDCYLCIRIDLKQGKRDSYAVVEITLRSRHDKTSGQDLTYKFLGSSLAVSTGQCDDSQRFAIDESHGAMPSCKLLKGLQGIFYLDKTRIIRCRHRRRRVHDSICSSRLQGLHCIFVTIEIFPLEGEEHLSALQRTGISRHRSAFLESAVNLYYVHESTFLYCRNRRHLFLFHQAAPPRPNLPFHISQPPSGRCARLD